MIKTLILVVCLSTSVFAKDKVSIGFPKNYKPSTIRKSIHTRVQLTHKEKQRKSLVKKVKKLASQEGINLTIYPDHVSPRHKTNLSISGEKSKVESFLKKLKSVVDKV